MPKDHPESQNPSPEAAQEILKAPESQAPPERSDHTAASPEERADVLPEAERDPALAREIIAADDALFAAAAEGAALDQQIAAALQEAGEETLRDFAASGVELTGDAKNAVAEIQREALSDEALMAALQQSGAFPEVDPERAQAGLQEILEAQNDEPILELLRQSGAFPQVSEEEIERRLQALLAEVATENPIEDKKIN